ncbi:hypothetical protein DSM112329_02922 [Paraconexibacter sp. AEG42_29]|uniref:Uncharacterized protein n=1 Tax=Paraconexibacter sp. AEG42_29 TaxID=2997339 RepID=A0AAU7AX84_9ACTN
MGRSHASGRQQTVRGSGLGVAALLLGLGASVLIVRRATFASEFIARHPVWIYLDAALAAAAGLLLFFASTVAATTRGRLQMRLLGVALAVAAAVIAAQDSLVGQVANPQS